MTNEKMLEIAYSAKAGLINPYDIKLCQTVENLTPDYADDYNKTSTDAAAKIGYMINCLKRDIAKEADRKTVNGNAVSVIEKLIMSYRNDSRPLTHATKIIDGKQYYCDGYILYKLDKPAESLPVDDKIEFGHAKILRDARENSLKNGAELALPTVQELKAKIAVEKAEWKAKRKGKHEKFGSGYDFGDGLPMVNAEFLLNTLLVVGADAKAYAKGDRGLTYFISGTTGNEALLMPLKKLRSENVI